MIKKLTKGLMISLASVAFIIGADKMTSETLILNDEVRSSSISDLIKGLTDDGYLLSKLMRTNLIINSPGGSVQQLDLLKAVVKESGRSLKTELPLFAASAAADIFLLGKERLMAEGSMILFHEVRIAFMGSYITFTDLKSILETGNVGPNSEINDPAIVDLIKNMIPKPVLTELVRQLAESHEGHINFLMERLDMTHEEVVANLLIPNVDVKLNLEQALKFKVATGEL